MMQLIETWKAAEDSAARGDRKSANAMRMVALANVLAAAETAILRGDGNAAMEKLNQLQKYASLAAKEIHAAASTH